MPQDKANNSSNNSTNAQTNGNQSNGSPSNQNLPSSTILNERADLDLSSYGGPVPPKED